MGGKTAICGAYSLFCCPLRRYVVLRPRRYCITWLFSLQNNIDSSAGISRVTPPVAGLPVRPYESLALGVPKGASLRQGRLLGGVRGPEIPLERVSMDAVGIGGTERPARALRRSVVPLSQDMAGDRIPQFGSCVNKEGLRYLMGNKRSTGDDVFRSLKV